MPKRQSGIVAETVRRVVLILCTAALVTGVTIAIEGWPSGRVPVREERIYGPTMPLGLVQLFGQGALFGAGVAVARRWLRVRL